MVYSRSGVPWSTAFRGQEDGLNWSACFVNGERRNRRLFRKLDTAKPYHSDSLRERHLNRAAGLPKLGWHAFRHTYRARLSQLEPPLEVQQKLMRHASIDMTTRYGRSSMLGVTRSANARIVEMIMQNMAENCEKGTGDVSCSIAVSANKR